MTHVPAIDAIDRKILDALHRNGRLTNAELSQYIGLSPSPCLRRVRALERAGIITGYSADIDEAKIGLTFSAFVSVTLDKQVDDALVAFERAILDTEAVVDCWLMTGPRDYLLRVTTEDLAGFEALVTGTLTRLPGVATIESSIPLRRVKAG